jgi:hypothetical protein
MARKHFIEYYRKLEQQYNEAREHANTLIKLYEQGQADKEIVDRFVETMRPICDTYAIFDKVKSLLLYDERKVNKSKNIPLEDYESCDVEEDKYTPAQIVKTNEECLESLDEQIQGIQNS